MLLTCNNILTGLLLHIDAAAKGCCTATTMTFTSITQLRPIFSFPLISLEYIMRVKKPQKPLRMTLSLPMAQFYVKSFSLFMW